MHSQLPENRLRELLNERGIKRVEIAYRCGVSHTQTVQRWEEGVIPQKYLPVLAELLDVDVPYLAGWSDVPKKDEAAA